MEVSIWIFYILTYNSILIHFIVQDPIALATGNFAKWFLHPFNLSWGLGLNPCFLLLQIDPGSSICTVPVPILEAAVYPRISGFFIGEYY